MEMSYSGVVVDDLEGMTAFGRCPKCGLDSAARKWYREFDLDILFSRRLRPIAGDRGQDAGLYSSIWSEALQVLEIFGQKEDVCYRNDNTGIESK
jgi:hypothetical protein